jgi:hypothetical protein
MTNISSDLWQEQAGSPKEFFGQDGFTAERIYRVPWSRREEAQVALIGDGLSIGGSFSQMGYPDRIGVVCEGITVKPQDGIAIDSPATLTDPETTLSSYAEYAIITARYKTIAVDIPDLPSVPEGYVDYSESSGKEAIFISNSALRFASATTQVPADADDQFINFQYVTERTYDWVNVSDPLMDVTRNLIGHVNDAEFVGCEAGTLLYEGTRKRKRFYYNPSPSTATQYWTLSHTFRIKRIVDENGAFVGGWNYVYDPETPGWQEVQLNNGGKPYPESDLNPLFQLP